MAPGPTLLLDTISLVYRAHHRAPPAAVGFVDHVAALQREHRPERTVLALDLPAPSFRRELCADYKRRRRRTPGRVRAELDALRPRFAELGEVHAVAGYEADDILATLTARLRAAQLPGLVATCDRDLIALAWGGIEVLLLGQHRDGAGQRFDAEAVRRRVGVAPQQYAEWQAFVGDRADGMPGVPDLHPRDAARLVREWGSAAAVLDHLPSVRPPGPRRRLEEHVERIRRNGRVLALREDVPL